MCAVTHADRLGPHSWMVNSNHTFVLTIIRVHSTGRIDRQQCFHTVVRECASHCAKNVIAPWRWCVLRFTWNWRCFWKWRSNNMAHPSFFWPLVVNKVIYFLANGVFHTRNYWDVFVAPFESELSVGNCIWGTKWMEGGRCPTLWSQVNALCFVPVSVVRLLQTIIQPRCKKL